MNVRLLKVFASASAALVLSACVSVLPDAPPPVPRFDVADVTPPAGTPVSWSLAIEDPIATRAIDSAQIARVRSGELYEYYADGQWVDRAPRLVHAATVRSFQNSGRILAVGSRTSQPFVNFILQTDIRSFEADATSGALLARAEIFAQLTDRRGRILAAKLFEVKTPLNSDNADQVTSALNRSMGQLLPDLVDWTLEQGEQAYRGEAGGAQAN